MYTRITYCYLITYSLTHSLRQLHEPKVEWYTSSLKVKLYVINTVVLVELFKCYFIMSISLVDAIRIIQHLCIILLDYNMILVKIIKCSKIQIISYIALELLPVQNLIGLSDNIYIIRLYIKCFIEFKYSALVGNESLIYIITGSRCNRYYLRI